MLVSDWRKHDYIGMDYKNMHSVSKNRHSQEYVELARNVAKKSQMLHRHGCVIVYKDKIITGYNTSLNLRNEIEGSSVHAEMNALKKARKILTKSELKNSKLYIIRIGTDSMSNPLKYSKPCPYCEKSIKDAGISKVFYSTNFERDKLETPLNLNLCRVC